MRQTFALAVLVLTLWSGSARAAMYGDFVIPGSLQPTPQAAQGHGNRTAISLFPSGGTPFIVYLPATAESGRYTPALQEIAARLSSLGEIAVFNVGGQSWFGSRQTLPGNVTFYDGFLHRNGYIYRFAFSMDSLAAPDASIKRGLARIWLLPGLSGSSGVNIIAEALDMFETGDFDNLGPMLNAAEMSDSGNWVVPYLRGRAADAGGDPDEALTHYRLARSLNPYDTEIQARVASMESLTLDADKGVNDLLGIASANPDEAAAWEELGRIYLWAEEFDAARDYFEQAAWVSPSSEIALYNLSFLLAQEGDYDNTLRRTREFFHYFPWMPNGMVPDVTNAPGMTEDRVQAILSEPLPIGEISSYAAVAPLPLTVEEINANTTLIQVVTPVTVYQTVEVYSPVTVYDWGWNTRYRRPRRSHGFGFSFGFGLSRPKYREHKKPAVRPPPSKPSPGRPGAGGRPGQSGSRPQPKPNGGRPSPGGRPEGGKPPQGGRPEREKPSQGARPEGGKPSTRPTPPNNGDGIGTGRPAVTPPTTVFPKKPAPGRERPTSPGSKVPPPSIGGERPSTSDGKRPARPGERPETPTERPSRPPAAITPPTGAVTLPGTNTVAEKTRPQLPRPQPNLPKDRSKPLPQLPNRGNSGTGGQTRPASGVTQGTSRPSVQPVKQTATPKPAPAAKTPSTPKPVAPAVKPAPAKQAPVKAAPAKPAPIKAAPAKPAPVKPAPVKSAPAKAAPAKNAPSGNNKKVERAPAKSSPASKAEKSAEELLTVPQKGGKKR